MRPHGWGKAQFDEHRRREDQGAGNKHNEDGWAISVLGKSQVQAAAGATRRDLQVA